MYIFQLFFQYNYMNILKQDLAVLLILILIVLFIICIIIYDLITNIYEFLTNDNVHSNDIPINDISYDNELDLTAPDRDMNFNPHNRTYSKHTSSRGGKKLPLQQMNNTDLENIVDQKSVLVDTTGDTPLVYSLDVLNAPENNTYQPPSIYTPSIHAIDAGSGNIIMNNNVNNHNLDKLKSIE